MSMAKIVMPSLNGLPFVCTDDMLPNPAWATLTALQVFNANPQVLENTSPHAKAGLESVLQTGVQVEMNVPKRG